MSCEKCGDPNTLWSPCAMCKDRAGSTLMNIEIHPSVQEELDKHPAAVVALARSVYDQLSTPGFWDGTLAMALSGPRMVKEECERAAAYKAALSAQPRMTREELVNLLDEMGSCYSSRAKAGDQADALIAIGCVNVKGE